MGMSASQARLIALTARMNDVEYQGQQINQQRVTLSNQTNALYNQLLEMSVPTPPSTSDFTRIEYTGKLGTTTYKFSASDVKPGKDGGYNVILGYTDYGNSLSRNNGYKTTVNGVEKVEQGIKFRNAHTETREADGYIPIKDADDSAPNKDEKFLKRVDTVPTSGDYYVMDETTTGYVLGGEGYVDDEKGPYFVLCTDPNEWDPATCIKINQETEKISCEVDVEAGRTVKASEVKDLYVMDEKGNITEAKPGMDYVIDSKTNEVTLIGDKTFFLDNGQGTDSASRESTTGVTISGRTAYTMEEYKEKYFNEKTIDTYNGYLEAIKNFGLCDKDGNPYGPENFMVYLDDNNKPHFALANDVKDNSGSCVTYDYISNGAYTKNQTYDGAKLTFDPASGRIVAIDIPTETDEYGNVTSWSTIDLEAATVTDELAYQDAFNDYTYEKDMYDKKQQEINAQTSIIQQQDKNLELKLTRLDNERNALKTEMDAVKEVVKNAIEKGFKTFSG